MQTREPNRKFTYLYRKTKSIPSLLQQVARCIQWIIKSLFSLLANFMSKKISLSFTTKRNE